MRKTIQGEQSRYFTHDSLGRLLYAKQPEQNANIAFNYTDSITNNSQWSVKYEYDDNGNITKTTDAKGVFVQGTYDNFNRLIFRNYSDATPDVGFFYDGKYLNINDQMQTATGSVKGKTTGVKSSVSRTNYTGFNNLGQLLTHQQITDGQTYQTSYQYDAFGRMISETYPSLRTVKVDYNANGDVSSIWGTVGTQNRLYANGFHYNSSGAMERMRLGNGKWESYAYNNRQQITEIGLGHSATDKSLLKLEYGYGNSTENNGNLRTQKITFNGLAQAFEQSYTYDSLNRLKSATETVSGVQNPTWKQTFDYDRFGNRRFDAANTTTLGSCSQAICNPLINTSDNRFSSGQNYLYDANGNVTQDANGKQFLYDTENHQKEVKDANNVTIGSYSYDGEGKRVKKISATEITIFVYNGGGTLVAEYSTQLATTPQVSYLTADHLGSPRVITDQNGAVTTRKDYTAFGEEASSAQRTANPNYDTSETRKGYTGYEKDSESGLEFAQARYYNATHGRFTSVDPLTASATIKNPQTFNRYSYVLNSPYKFTDPLGLLSVTTNACGQWCRNSYQGEGRSGGAASGGNYKANEGEDSAYTQTQQTAEAAASSVNNIDINSSIAIEGDGQIRFDKVEVFDTLDGEPTSTTTPPLNGESNSSVPATDVDIGYNPGATTFYVKVSVSVEGDGKIVNSVNSERPDEFNTRVEANTSSDSESASGRNRQLNLAIMPGSDPPVTQRVDISESGKTATITFAVKLNNDYAKGNSFTVTVYSVRNTVFGPRGKLNVENSMRGTLKIKLHPLKPTDSTTKPTDPRDRFIKKNPF